MKNLSADAANSRSAVPPPANLIVNADDFGYGRGINRGILLPPGLDEQWLISVMHEEKDAMRYADVFAEFVADLTA